MNNLNILVPLAVALFGALGAYLAAVRKLSGTVATSTADDLWEESRSIRQDYQRRIEELNRNVSSLQARVETLDTRNERLALVNSEMKLKIEELRVTVAQLERDKADMRLTRLEEINGD